MSPLARHRDQWPSVSRPLFPSLPQPVFPLEPQRRCSLCHAEMPNAECRLLLNPAETSPPQAEQQQQQQWEQKPPWRCSRWHCSQLETRQPFEVVDVAAFDAGRSAGLTLGVELPNEARGLYAPCWRLLPHWRDLVVRDFGAAVGMMADTPGRA